MARKRLFTPLGVDHIVIACYSRHYWRHVLKHIGFRDYFSPRHENDPDSKRAFELFYGAPLKFGNVKFLLVDCSTSSYNPKQIYEFLARSGDFHVCSVAILVDNMLAAQEEIGGNFVLRDDPFGWTNHMIFLPPHGQFSFWWQFVEREQVSEERLNQWGSEDVDHIAIAVGNLKETQTIYQKLGFQTVYRPRVEIRGQYSGMKTVAMQRGGWTVALVEGVDREKRSQVTAYARAHGNHSAQHIALRFTDVEQAVRELSLRQVNFRHHSLSEVSSAANYSHIIHYGKDHAGALLQSFTKPFLRFVRWDTEGVFTADGLFFECMERLQATNEISRREFYNKTVRGLYRSIEQEENDGEEITAAAMLPPDVMARFEYDARYEALYRANY